MAVSFRLRHSERGGVWDCWPARVTNGDVRSPASVGFGRQGGVQKQQWAVLVLLAGTHGVAHRGCRQEGIC